MNIDIDPNLTAIIPPAGDTTMTLEQAQEHEDAAWQTFLTAERNLPENAERFRVMDLVKEWKTTTDHPALVALHEAQSKINAMVKAAWSEELKGYDPNFDKPVIRMSFQFNDMVVMLEEQLCPYQDELQTSLQAYELASDELPEYESYLKARSLYQSIAEQQKRKSQ